MAIEILNGPITGPYLVDDSDIVVVSDDAVVSSDASNSGAIDNRATSDAGISIFVDGTISNTGDYGDGIRLVGQSTNDIGGNLVQVRDGGVVRGFHGIDLIYGQNSSVIVSGRVEGTFSGINAETDNVAIAVSGTVIGDNAAIALYYGDNGSITNSGHLRATSAGVVVYSSDQSAIANDGKILAVSTGVYSVNSDNLTLLNRGTINATNQSGGIGVELHTFAGLSLDNEGRIAGDYAIKLSDVTGEISNSGKIVGQSVALDISSHGYNPESMVSIHNSGLIKAETALRAYHGQVHLTNLGEIKGKLVFGDDTVTPADAHSTIRNGGEIFGSVYFSDLDDLYRGIEDGTVSGFVFGGKGQDRLIGGAASDDLRGGSGNDLLKGKDGADVLAGGQDDDILKGGWSGDDLSGGQGDDFLIGGKGNDMLRGGGGEDVFVFGPNSGTDSVQDFGDGNDLMQIVGHTGEFASLVIADDGADLKITHDGGVIMLLGEAGTTLTVDDFMFG